MYIYSINKSVGLLKTKHLPRNFWFAKALNSTFWNPRPGWRLPCHPSWWPRSRSSWHPWSASRCGATGNKNPWWQELVGGWTNPSEKYARQIGSSPQVGMNIKNIWNQHLEKKRCEDKRQLVGVFFCHPFWKMRTSVKLDHFPQF